MRKNKIPFCAKMYCSFAFLFHFGLMTSLVNGKRITMKCFSLPTSFDALVEHIDDSTVWVSELKTNIYTLDTQHNQILQISQLERHDCSGTYKNDIEI